MHGVFAPECVCSFAETVYVSGTLAQAIYALVYWFNQCVSN